MEQEVTNEVNTTDDFWTQIESVLSRQCQSHDHIDEVLRSYLELLQAHHEKYITTDDHLGHCAYLLYTSSIFTKYAAYVRNQLVHCLLQEDDVSILRIAATFLLADARENEPTFDLLNKEGSFPRLVELIAQPRENEESLHRTLMELLYEMSRIQKITSEIWVCAAHVLSPNSTLEARLTINAACITDQFVCNLFDIIEEVSDDVNDPYHYPVIRVLLVLNEQFMVAAHDPSLVEKKAMPLTNKVVKVLSSKGSKYKTFGANIILLLNREDETSLQLLTLKLMYLLFTTPPTYEYFYTNDLRVLVDILVRNLLDLPEYKASLRHTYLRVLYPLLEHTQLQYPPHYKRQEIQKLLALLCGSKVDIDGANPLAGTAWNHFEDVDETTKRLVRRCQTVSWLIDTDSCVMVRVESPTDDRSTGPGSPTSPISPTKSQPPQLPAPRKLRKRDSSKESTLTVAGFLAPQLEGARQSSISMAEMAKQREKPGVITPSRNPTVKQGLRQAIFTKKEKPPPPKARRSGSIRPSPQPCSSELEVARQVVSAPQPDTEPQQAAGDSHSPPGKQETRNEKHDLKVETAVAPIKAVAATEEPKVQPRKPPPAPKARRGWRTRKSKDLDGEGYEPGRFSTNMPSVRNPSVTSPFSPTAADSVPDSSPFSPPSKDKTLDPRGDIVHENGDSERKSRSKRSVGAAMIQAQAEATKQVEESFEGTHISEPAVKKQSAPIPTPPSPTTPRRSHPPRTTSLQHHNKDNRTSSPFEPESPPQSQAQSPTQHRVILTPPGQAPIRGVPGPRVEVEKSPFLSDEDQEKEDVVVVSRVGSLDTTFEDAKETQTLVDREEYVSRLPASGRKDGFGEVGGEGLGRGYLVGNGGGHGNGNGRLSRRESWEDFENDE